MLERLKNNPRLLVAGVVVLGALLLLSNAGNSSDSEATDQENETTTSEQAEGETTENETAEGEAQTPSEDTEATEDTTAAPAADTDSAVDVEPASGPVEPEKKENSFVATLRAGDNQTVAVRQIVSDYLGEQEKSLNDEQRLYMETVLVNTLPRNDHVAVGEMVEVTIVALEKATGEAEALDAATQALWAMYL